LTEPAICCSVDNMKAESLYHDRIQYGDTAFAHVVVWQLSQPVLGCAHCYKYRLAYVVAGDCVIRYDNERGKGDHQHRDGVETAIAFVSLPQLLTDFFAEIDRWNDEHHLF